jgi:hypothetical protein
MDIQLRTFGCAGMCLQSRCLAIGLSVTMYRAVIVGQIEGGVLYCRSALCLGL